MSHFKKQSWILIASIFLISSCGESGEKASQAIPEKPKEGVAPPIAIAPPIAKLSLTNSSLHTIQVKTLIDEERSEFLKNKAGISKLPPNQTDTFLIHLKSSKTHLVKFLITQEGREVENWSENYDIKHGDKMSLLFNPSDPDPAPDAPDGSNPAPDPDPKKKGPDPAPDPDPKKKDPDPAPDGSNPPPDPDPKKKASVIPVFPTPDAPTIEKSDETSLKLTWVNNPLAKEYKLLRSTDANGAFTAIYTGTNSSYEDKGLAKSQMYFYQVSMSDGKVWRDSTVVNSIVGLNTPRITLVQAVGRYKIKVTWEADPYAETYHLYHENTKQGIAHTRVYQGTSNTVVNTKLKKHTNYYYQVEACTSKFGCSGKSPLHLTIGTTTGAYTVLAGDNGFILPDTGQKKKYARVAGEDSDYNGYQKSFKDNGDDTITEQNTGLTWQKRSYKTNYRRANAYCSNNNNLKLGGRDDWRVPSIFELYTLIDHHHDTGKTKINSLFTNTKKLYLSETSIFSDTRVILGLYFKKEKSTDYFGGTEEYVYKGDEVHLRCVSGIEASFNVKKHPKKEFWITDGRTGLIWMNFQSLSSWRRRSGGQLLTLEQSKFLNKKVRWKTAIEACEALTLTGKRDWRLPNILELHSLIDYQSRRKIKRIGASEDKDDFLPEIFDTYQRQFWSSTSYNKDKAWAISFVDGTVEAQDKKALTVSKEERSYLCVR